MFEKQCERCGKKIFVRHPTLWAYKYQSKYRMNFFCSWSCMQESRKAFPSTRSHNGTPVYPDPVGTWKQ